MSNFNVFRHISKTNEFIMDKYLSHLDCFTVQSYGHQVNLNLVINTSTLRAKIARHKGIMYKIKRINITTKDKNSNVYLSCV